jgi:hypothetical protein
MTILDKSDIKQSDMKVKVNAELILKVPLRLPNDEDGDSWS